MAHHLRMASNSVVTVFVIGKQELPCKVQLTGDCADFVENICRKVRLTIDERNAFVLRTVDGEPNKRNAQSKFASAGETAEIIDTATLPVGGDYVVGEIRGGLF